MSDPISKFIPTTTNLGFDEDPSGETERKQRNIIRMLFPICYMMNYDESYNTAEDDKWEGPFWVIHIFL